MASETQKQPRYNGIPKQVTLKNFNRYIKPHLSKRIKGPKPKLSSYKIFNYILYVLHTVFNHKLIKEQGLLPVIYPNRRNAKEPIVIARKFR